MNFQKNNSRREFLRTFSLLTGSTLLLTQMPWLRDLHAQEPGRKVRLGIIGSGSRGNLLQLYLKDIPECEMTCVCDNYPPNLQIGLSIAGKQAKAYTNHIEMS